MATTAPRSERAGAATLDRARGFIDDYLTVDAWPRTTRLFPWLIAAFIVMLVLVPFDSLQAKISLPIDSKMDRFAVGAIAYAWILTVGSRYEQGPRWRRLGLFGVGLFVLIVAAGASIDNNYTTLSFSGEVTTCIKRYALLVSYALFAFLVATTIESRDIRGLAKLLIGVGCLCALGVIYEYRAKHNLFFDWGKHIFGPAFDLTPKPTEKYAYERRLIVGPTRHGLAVTAMLSMIAPLALAMLLQAKERRTRILYGIAVAVLLLGGLSTLRRTAVFAPLALVLAFLLYRRREFMRLMPYLIPAYGLGQVLTPGAGGNIKGQLLGSNSISTASTEGRTEDYIAVHLDVLHHPLLGRGYAGYQLDRYRVLDNQYLLLLVEVGIVGVLCYLLVIGGAWARAHALQRRSRDEYRRWFGVAVIASTAVFAVTSALFDCLSFPQPVYLFMLLSGMIAVMMSDEESGVGEQRGHLT